MKRQRTVVLGLALAATLAFPAIAGAAGLDGAAQVGNTGLDSRIALPNPAPDPPQAWSGPDVDGGVVVTCNCLNHRLPAIESWLETAAY